MLKYIAYSEERESLTANPDVTSRVLIAETAVPHSGTYRCEPGAAPIAQVHVHVIDGESQET